jgi:cbb3-type cytochrome oxidase subunit 3
MPWLLFVWMLVVWDLLRHYSNQAAAIITVVVFVGCFIQIVLWFSGKRWGPVSLLALGVLCLLACSLGIGIAEIGWDHWWRENWWLHTGVQSHADSASTPAASRSDAALLSFWNTRTQTTFNDTAVDYMRSAGYKDGHFYCVAPILDPDMAEASLVSVNYWAIGIDCCQNLGDFSCDASRQNGGAYGIVMLEHGFPSPGANADKFRGAVLKAETMHGLVSAPQAMFVRYVHTPSDVTTPLMVQSVLFLVISVLVGLLVFSILGFIAWYYGVGKRDSFDSLAYFLPRQPKQLV